MYRWSKRHHPDRHLSSASGSVGSRTTGTSSLTLPRTVPKTTQPRKPKKGCAIAPYYLRPHVPAKDRLRLWKPSLTTTAEHQSQNSYIPLSQKHQKAEIMLRSLDQTTQGNYGSGLLRFTEYCDTHSIPEDNRFPASDELLASFLSSWAGKRADSTVHNWMSGLQFWHHLYGASWLAGPQCAAVIKGIKKMVPEESRRPKRPPVTHHHMTVLERGLDRGNTFDAAVLAMASVAFWSVCRLGELAVKSTAKIDPSLHVHRGCNKGSGMTRNGGRYENFDVPRTKTSPSPVTFSITHYPGEPTCPGRCFLNHLRINGTVPPEAPLFAYITADGWSPLTADWFMNRCNEIWAKAGLSRITGHSFRIGGATELLLRGVPPEMVKAQGRWSSDAFLRYWRKIEEILPMFLHCAAHSFSHDSLSARMHSFNFT